MRLNAPIELDLNGFFRADDFPRVAEFEPFIRTLHLVAVDDFLAEDAKLIADAIAHAGQVLRSHRVQEAGCQAAEAAVAKARVRLFFQEVGKLNAQVTEHFLSHRPQAQVDEVVAQCAPEQIFRREIIGAFHIAALVSHFGLGPAFGKLIKNDVREGEVAVIAGGCFKGGGPGEGDVLQEGFPKTFGRNSWLSKGHFGQVRDECIHSCLRRRREKTLMSLMRVDVNRGAVGRVGWLLRER